MDENIINQVIEYNEELEQKNLMLRKQIIQLNEKLLDYKKSNTPKELFGLKDIAYEFSFDEDEKKNVKARYTKDQLFVSNVKFASTGELSVYQHDIDNYVKRLDKFLLSFFKTLHLDNYTEAFKIDGAYRFAEKDMSFIAKMMDDYDDSNNKFWKLLKDKSDSIDNFLTVYLSEEINNTEFITSLFTAVEGVSHWFRNLHENTYTIERFEAYFHNITYYNTIFWLNNAKKIIYGCVPILEREIPKLVEGAELYDFEYFPLYSYYYRKFLDEQLEKLRKFAKQTTDDWERVKVESDLRRTKYVNDYQKNSDMYLFMEYVIDLVYKKYKSIQESHRYTRKDTETKKKESKEEIRKKDFEKAKKDVFFGLFNCDTSEDWPEIRESILIELSNLVNAYKLALDEYNEEIDNLKSDSTNNENLKFIKELEDKKQEYIEERMDEIIDELNNKMIDITVKYTDKKDISDIDNKNTEKP